MFAIFHLHIFVQPLFSLQGKKKKRVVKKRKIYVKKYW